MFTSRRICLFLCLFFVVLSPAFADELDLRIDKLTQSEKEDLEQFFASGIQHFYLGHVLFFLNPDKPVCSITTFIHPEEKSALFRGWEVWKKYESSFPHPNFIVQGEIKNMQGLNVLTVYFINKKALKCTLKEIKKGMIAQQSIRDLLKMKQGRPMTFSEQLALDKLALGGLAQADPLGRGNLQPIVCGEHAAAVEEFYRGSKDQGRPLTLTQQAKVRGISFWGDPNTKETQTLKKQYTAELEKLEVMVSQKNLLRQSLKALSQ